MAVDFQGGEYIEVGDFHAVPFTAEDPGIYQFTVDSEYGESIAILILDAANFQKYQANQTFEYEDYTVAVMEKRQITLLAGNYYFIIDNSERIAPSPESPIQVEYSMQEELPFSDMFNSILIIGVISVVIVVVMIVILLYFLRKDERKRQEALRRYPSQVQTKYCKHCGHQIPVDTSVCPHCGKRN